jgi:nitrite reductase (NO-forming)
MKPPTSRRVVESHQIARAAFVAAAAFGLVAVGWAIYVLMVGGSWWGPLHSFLAGTVLLAISGASQMFTITWSSTRPPSRGVASSQRWLVIAGVAAVLAGVAFSIEALIWTGGTAVVGGIALLAWTVLTSIRRSLLRRFDLSARFYITAFACGIVGVTLGTIMGTGAGAVSFETLRLAHAHLNLLGLVGLTIIGTIPTLLPTTAHSRAVSGREALWAWWLALGGSVMMTAGIWAPRAVGAGSLAVALSGALILIGIVSRLWERGRRQLPFAQISIGSAWLLGWAIVDAVSVIATGAMPHFQGWTAAAVVGGVGQVLAGSLAYLVPVLKGSPFEKNRRTMESNGWIPLLTANAGALCLGLGFAAGAGVACGLWVLDFGLRLLRVIVRSGAESE